MSYKVGEIVKIKRKRVCGELEPLKDSYDTHKEITLKSFYVIIEEVYPPTNMNEVCGTFVVKDILTGYTESVDSGRFYGDRRNLKVKVREYKITGILPD